MNVLIAGGLGFIGRRLSEFFLDRGHRVTATGSKPAGKNIERERFVYLSADTTLAGAWQDHAADADAVINLAGRTIFKRWTASYKQQILDSRILTTRNLVEALPENKKVVLVNASGVGVYGNRSDDRLNEEEPAADDFLARVSVAWEAEAAEAGKKRVRVVIARFGVVLGKDGGAMSKMIPAFRYFVGGPMGNGRQWFPWIHIDDLIRAVWFVIENPGVEGACNFCSPQPVRNREFANALGRVLHRPSFMPTPALAIRLAMGEMGSMVLFSQRAIPEKLLHHGFRFQHPDIQTALSAVVAGEA